MFDPLTIASPRLGRLYGYWEARRGDRPMPSRADIDPLDFTWILGNVSLIDVGADGDFRWRLDGTNLTVFFGCDMTGRSILDYPFQGHIASLHGSLLEAVQARAPLRTMRRFSSDAHRWDYESLFLPLSADGGRVDMLLQGIEIERR